MAKARLLKLDPNLCPKCRSTYIQELGRDMNDWSRRCRCNKCLAEYIQYFAKDDLTMQKSPTYITDTSRKVIWNQSGK